MLPLGALVLLEFAVLSPLFYYAFSRRITAPPATPKDAPAQTLSLCGFLCAVLSVRDVCGQLTLVDDLSEPLYVEQQL